jgi:hypothetical protein
MKVRVKFKDAEERGKRPPPNTKNVQDDGVSNDAQVYEDVLSLHVSDTGIVTITTVDGVDVLPLSDVVVTATLKPEDEGSSKARTK